MKDSNRRFIFVGMICAVAYTFILFILKTIFNILSLDEPMIPYILPIVIILFFITILKIGYCISLTALSYCYIATGIFCGHGINTFFICCLYRLIALFHSFSITNAILFSLGGPFIFSIYGLINGYVIQIDRMTLLYPGFQSKRKICHLSDLHLGSIYQRGLVQRVVNKVMEVNPDVVVITGDMADGTENVKTEWLKPFDSLSMPILFITGNHEVLMGSSLMLKRINETNIRHIGLSGTGSSNTNGLIQAGGLNFLGIDFEEDLMQRLKDFSLQSKDKHQSNIPSILLSHVPNLTPDELREYGLFLFLCGHTHGGQIFPFQPLAWLFNKCFSGLYSTQDNKHHVFVSSGIGSSIVPMRIFSRPVIGLITIQGQ